MPGSDFRFHHDFVDPASYLVREILHRLGAGDRLDLRPFELRQSTAPLIDPTEPGWREYVAAMSERARELAVPFDPPELVPWSAKAHELALHAAETDPDAEIHGPIYLAYFQEGRDIGRVDILVEIAREAGLDPTETKAVLDVDRWSRRLEEERAAAIDAGVRGVPTLVLAAGGAEDDAEGARLEGFHTEEEIGTFLQRAAGRPRRR